MLCDANYRSIKLHNYNENQHTFSYCINNSKRWREIKEQRGRAQKKKRKKKNTRKLLKLALVPIEPGRGQRKHMSKMN
ncbi:hypothetical protein P8452_32390 [Trifolium repens]|nr:hypothetical protein P8452_32390 [Trifolium repens]